MSSVSLEMQEQRILFGSAEVQLNCSIALAPKMTAMVHGACIGAGIELATFCKIIAKEDAFFQLPEIGLGLLPGAGGTASLPRRIGRYDTALLAITGKTIYSDEALELGLMTKLDPINSVFSPVFSYYPAKQLAGLVVWELCPKLNFLGNLELLIRSLTSWKSASETWLWFQDDDCRHAFPCSSAIPITAVPASWVMRTSHLSGERFSPPRTITSSTRPREIGSHPHLENQLWLGTTHLNPPLIKACIFSDTCSPRT